MTHTKLQLALCLVALVLSGCASSPETAGATPAAGQVTAAAPDTLQTAAAANATVPPLRLYLGPDLKLAFAPPSAEGEVTLGTPFNSPLTGDYPTWTGVLASDMRVEGDIPVRVYVTSSSANVEANQLPVFADLPAIDVTLMAGNTSWGADLSGPAVVHVGEVALYEGKLHAGRPVTLAAGTALRLDTGVYFSHVAAAGEFRFVMGPQHPTGIGAPGAAP